ncbi:MAG: hypothetical protein FJY38_07225 [Betaproteobacteria bacterium]|nr:hypothetical protein [Betaproteobacteria bacterium]
MRSNWKLGSHLAIAVVALLLGALAGWGLDRALPADRAARELVLLAHSNGIPLQPFGLRDSLALAVCEQSAKRPYAEVDCLLPRGGQPVALDPNWLGAMQAKLVPWYALRDRLDSALRGDQRAAWLLATVNQRIGRIEELIRDATPVNDPRSVAASRDASAADQPYAKLFNAALLAEGLRYNALSGSFAIVRWDLARLIDDRTRLLERVKLHQMVLKWLPLGFGLLTAAILFFGFLYAGPAALAVGGLLAAGLGLGLAIIGDASLRYGEGAAGFGLNPFLYALSRQVLALVLAVVVGLLVLFFCRRVLSLANWGGAHLNWVALIGALLTVMAYGFSPAAGSEILKIWMAGLAGLALASHARVADSARQVVSGLWNPWEIFKQSMPARLSAPQVIRRELSRTLGIFSLFAILALGAAAVLFQDLGGTLVSAAVFWALMSLLFGPGAGGAAILVGAVLALLALQTDKVAARVDLMLSPMSAAVSDFARLLKFEQAARPDGYGLGTIQWCSFEGACLPLQSLSDYMPVLLQGALGPVSSGLVFIVLALAYLMLMWVCIRGVARSNHGHRALYASAFFLFLAALAQSSLTVFGSLRLLPLTGLGLPLLSLGVSSSLSVVLALALLASAQRLSRDRP